jgi:hypothetical protein
MTEALELMHAVARKLTGRAVMIRFCEPMADIPARGATYKGLDGGAVIDMNPARYSAAELLETFTHELAHVVKHLSIMTPVNVTIASAVYHVPSKHADPVRRDIEAEAEALAETWRRVIRYDWMNYQRPYEGKFCAMLRALLALA